MLTNSQNLDKLDDDVKSVIAYAFRETVIGWSLPYMIEVRLDNPLKNLMEGGEGLHIHGGGGSRHYAHHENEEHWAIMHIEDEDWKMYQTNEIADKGASIVKNYKPNYT